jgi:hypothetical protein
MPPKDNKVNAVNLTPEQLGLLALWIDQGAKESERRQEVIAWQPVSATFNAIYAVALSADGQFAACGRGNRLFLHHVPTGRLIGELADPTLATNAPGHAHLDLVNALAFNPADDTLASGGFAEVKLWRRGESQAEPFAGPVGWPTNALKSADGSRSVSLATNGLARLQDGNGKLLAELRHGRARQRELTAAETALTVARQRQTAAGKPTKPSPRRPRPWPKRNCRHATPGVRWPCVKVSWRKWSGRRSRAPISPRSRSRRRKNWRPPGRPWTAPKPNWPRRGAAWATRKTNGISRGWPPSRRRQPSSLPRGVGVSASRR